MKSESIWLIWKCTHPEDHEVHSAFYTKSEARVEIEQLERQNSKWSYYVSEKPIYIYSKVKNK